MKTLSFLVFCILFPFYMLSSDFLSNQLTHKRVVAAKEKYDASLSQLFKDNKLNYPSKYLYLRIFKKEKLVEVWASDNSVYTLIKTYPFTASSGKPGPKVREGDLQIPEGFYQISHFNPVSNFHLSFKINYPNQADLKRNVAEKNPGSDIFIHGKSVTVGCVPIGDKNIAELYWLCAKVYQNNAIIPVHIFPCKMNDSNLHNLYQEYPVNVSFWKSIQPMYRFFESHKMLGEVIGMDELGNYKMGIPWD